MNQDADPRAALAAACDERAALLAASPSTVTALQLLRNAARSVALALACQAEDSAARAADIGAVAAAAAMLLLRGAIAGEAFTVHVNLSSVLPGASALALPVGHIELGGLDWLLGFGCAALARHAAALGLLAAPTTLQALAQARAEPVVAPQGPGCDAPAWAVPLAAMLAVAARRDATAVREAGAAPPAVADAPAGPRTLWQAARRFAAGETGALLAQALAALQPAWQDATTDLAARGLVALALDAQAVAPDPAWSTGVTALPRCWPAPTLRACHALRAVRHADEARWSLDLAGYPRASRRHHIARRALGAPPVEHLVACYEMQATAGTPLAAAEFLLLEPAASPGNAAVPLALDAGQLLWLAEVFSSGNPDAALLEEAVACVRAALQRLGQAERLDKAQFGSSLGRQVWQAEPGRFSRARMSAYGEALAQAHADALARQHVNLPPPAAAAGDPVDAMRLALQGAEAIKHTVAPLLQALRHDGGLVARLRPQPQDYDKVFSGAAGKTAREAYEALWAQPAALFRQPAPEQTALKVFVAPAGLLGSGVDLVQPFPTGYRAIVPLLDPHRTWVCWKYTRPEQAIGLSYDGLVWCDDHWSWFPKPYRVLVPLLTPRPA